MSRAAVAVVVAATAVAGDVAVAFGGVSTTTTLSCLPATTRQLPSQETFVGASAEPTTPSFVDVKYFGLL